MSDATDERGRILVPALMALMGASLFAYTYAGATVIPMWDGWTWIAHAKAYADGGIGELVRSKAPLVHGQHLYLLPSVTALIVGPLVDYSFRPFAFLSVITLVACGVMCYRLARRNGLGRFEALIVFLTVASFRHYENLLLGFQFGIVLCVLLGSLAVIVADRHRDRRGFALALALAAGSALSSSAGILAVITVFLVRWFDPRRARNWIVVGLAVATVMLLLHVTLTGFDVMERSIVAYEIQQLTWSTFPVIFEDCVKLIGGGLVGGRTSAPVGFFLLAGACALLVVQVRRTQRIDALSGLALFSLACTATIAIARSPIVEPAARHAIFAAPLVCVCAIGLLQLVCSRGVELRAASCTALSVGLVWLSVDALGYAAAHRDQVAAGEIETRTHLARLAGDSTLTDEEIAQVNNGERGFILSLMQHLRERRLSIFSPDYHGFELHEELPTHARDMSPGMSDERIEGGALRFAGPGSVYNTYRCAFPSGCKASLFVDVAVQGQATIGIMVRRADGTEKTNVLVPASEVVPRHFVRVDAEAGELLEPYVFCNGPKDIARIESFSFVLLQKSQIP